jgi:uncharacterized protein DUF6766
MLPRPTCPPTSSLGLTMAALFLLSWLAQSIAGLSAYNEEQLGQLTDPLTWPQYIASADFWNRTPQTGSSSPSGRWPYSASTYASAAHPSPSPSVSPTTPPRSPARHLHDARRSRRGPSRRAGRCRDLLLVNEAHPTGETVCISSRHAPTYYSVDPTGNACPGTAGKDRPTSEFHAGAGGVGMAGLVVAGKSVAGRWL